ncbi:hypothetical protein OBBRIDRAFT_730880, partial [Obba rivulosa]
MLPTTALRGTQECRIPPEVTDRIIDVLSSDKRALRKCSLTCRRWLPRSRFHLFKTIELIRQPAPIEEFALFLKSSSHVSPYVQSLAI